jgi:hypothetical protein
MPESFDEFVKREKIDAEALIQATRYYIAEQSHDPTAEEMRDRVAASSGDAAAVDAAVAALAGDARLLELACHEVLEAAWDKPQQPGRIRSAVDDAKSALPVIETGIIAMVAMYGMYLYTTGGKKSEVRGKDGTLKTEWYPPALSHLVDLLRGGNGAAK